MIDAAVNGGTWKYVEAFLADSAFSSEHPELVPVQAQLRQALKTQLNELKAALDLFASRVKDELRPLLLHLQCMHSFVSFCPD